MSPLLQSANAGQSAHSKHAFVRTSNNSTFRSVAFILGGAMTTTPESLWERYQKYFSHYPALGLSLDISRMNFPDDYFDSMGPRMQTAFAAMNGLEAAPSPIPMKNAWSAITGCAIPHSPRSPAIRQEIQATLQAVKDFARQVHSGAIHGAHGPFANLLVIGIGGARSGHNSSPTPSASPLPINSPFISLTTPIPTAWTKCCPACGPPSAKLFAS